MMMIKLTGVSVFGCVCACDERGKRASDVYFDKSAPVVFKNSLYLWITYIIEYMYIYTSKIQNHFARIIFFEVTNTIFHYDLVLISLNDKIIRYMFQAKNQFFKFFFNYLGVL